MDGPAVQSISSALDHGCERLCGRMMSLLRISGTNPLRTGLTPESREIAVFQNDLRDLGVETRKEAIRNLLFLAERKYNRYDLYAPGETFPQRLVDWLSNFDAEDRNAAMDVVHELRFFNQNEMRALAAATLQNIVTAIQSEAMPLSRASAISY